MSVTIGTVPTFAEPRADKEQVRKVLEEAAEVFGAWQGWHGWNILWQDWDEYDKQHHGMPNEEMHRAELANECADLIQATCNLLAGLGVTDLQYAMRECRNRNESRGRKYGD